MERLVNYSSEDEREDSPKRNTAESCPALNIDPIKRSKGDSSRRPREESQRSSTADRGQSSSSYRDKDSSHNSFRKFNNQKEESSRGSGRLSTSSKDNYHRSDRRYERGYDKRRDHKDERKRRDGHKDRDRDYECRDGGDRHDRSEKHRRDRYDKDSSYREKDRRRRSNESSPPPSKDRNAGNNRKRNRSKSRSRSPSKDYSLHNTASATMPPVDTLFRGGKPLGFNQKDIPHAPLAPPTSKNTFNLPPSGSLPLHDTLPKMVNPISKPDGTPTVLPTYYNPNIINPTKYAEQVQKRKLIWGAKKAEDTAAKWGHATFSEDSDGRVASKFMRLMGIKSAPKPGEGATDSPTGEKTGPDVKSRQAMFSNMEQQYEVARQVTHTMRGVGLGFSSQSRQY